MKDQQFLSSKSPWVLVGAISVMLFSKSISLAESASDDSTRLLAEKIVPIVQNTESLRASPESALVGNDPASGNCAIGLVFSPPSDMDLGLFKGAYLQCSVIGTPRFGEITINVLPGNSDIEERGFHAPLRGERRMAQLVESPTASTPPHRPGIVKVRLPDMALERLRREGILQLVLVGSAPRFPETAYSILISPLNEAPEIILTKEEAAE